MATQIESIKWINGTNFIVDGFQFISPKCTHYFLTHFHSDHTIGLTKGFNAGVIYCSPVTANLLLYDKGMDQRVVVSVPLGKPIVIDNVEITFLDANHCPGAAMILFKVPQDNGSTKNILHTGDCRWQGWMREQPGLKGVNIHMLYLDTTYALPKHTFPSQQDAIQQMARAMQDCLREEPSTRFMVAAYHIGKERAIFGAARLLGCKVWAPVNKRAVFKLIELPESDMQLLSSDPEAALIHVGHWGMYLDGLERELNETKMKGVKQIVGVRPTGWTYRKKGVSIDRRGGVAVIGVPYSEHSSWNDLRLCVEQLRPKKIIPTVNAWNTAKMRAIVDRFADLMDLSGDKSRLHAYFTPAAKRPKPSTDTPTPSPHLSAPESLPGTGMGPSCGAGDDDTQAMTTDEEEEEDCARLSVDGAGCKVAVNDRHCDGNDWQCDGVDGQCDGDDWQCDGDDGQCNGDDWQCDGDDDGRCDGDDAVRSVDITVCDVEVTAQHASCSMQTQHMNKGVQHLEPHHTDSHPATTASSVDTHGHVTVTEPGRPRGSVHCGGEHGSTTGNTVISSTVNRMVGTPGRMHERNEALVMVGTAGRMHERNEALITVGAAGRMHERSEALITVGTAGRMHERNEALITVGNVGRMHERSEALFMVGGSRNDDGLCIEKSDVVSGILGSKMELPETLPVGEDSVKRKRILVGRNLRQRQKRMMTQTDEKEMRSRVQQSHVGDCNRVGLRSREDTCEQLLIGDGDDGVDHGTNGTGAGGSFVISANGGKCDAGDDDVDHGTNGTGAGRSFVISANGGKCDAGDDDVDHGTDGTGAGRSLVILANGGKCNAGGDGGMLVSHHRVGVEHSVDHRIDGAGAGSSLVISADDGKCDDAGDDGGMLVSHHLKDGEHGNNDGKATGWTLGSSLHKHVHSPISHGVPEREGEVHNRYGASIQFVNGWQAVAVGHHASCKHWGEMKALTADQKQTHPCVDPACAQQQGKVAALTADQNPRHPCLDPACAQQQGKVAAITADQSPRHPCRDLAYEQHEGKIAALASNEKPAHRCCDLGYNQHVDHEVKQVSRTATSTVKRDGKTASSEVAEAGKTATSGAKQIGRTAHSEVEDACRTVSSEIKQSGRTVGSEVEEADGTDAIEVKEEPYEAMVIDSEPVRQQLSAGFFPAAPEPHAGAVPTAAVSAVSDDDLAKMLGVDLAEQQRILDSIRRLTPPNIPPAGLAGRGRRGGRSGARVSQPATTQSRKKRQPKSDGTIGNKDPIEIDLEGPTQGLKQSAPRGRRSVQQSGRVVGAGSESLQPAQGPAARVLMQVDGGDCGAELEVSKEVLSGKQVSQMGFVKDGNGEGQAGLGGGGPSSQRTIRDMFASFASRPPSLHQH